MTISDISLRKPESGKMDLKPLFDVLLSDYADGFRFEPTSLRLLMAKSGIELGEEGQVLLKQMMFGRDDGVFFLLDVVADEASRNNMVEFGNAFLDEYGCFETSELYALYADNLNSRCIRNVYDFEKFYEHELVSGGGVTCVAAPYIGNRVARRRSGNVWERFEVIAAQIIAVTNDEFGGVVSEEDLHTRFCAFSTDLIAKIIKHRAETDILRVEMNGIVCYQTLEALGLPDDFSDTLSNILQRFEDLKLHPNEEALHTALSLALGVNFKTEFNIPDQATYRRLIEIYYKANPPRRWRGGVFGAV